MLSQFILTAALAAGALASPVEYIGSDWDLEWISKNDSLPKVVYVQPINACPLDGVLTSIKGYILLAELF